MKYTDLKKSHEEIISSLPLFWAFSDSQLKEGMEKIGAKEISELVSI